ncbi:PAS domain-containing protein [Halapricum hydrolyticum]|uniref:histidine kinase n=1 Tax=Halapricum hydrolyticum TaxID=2979991 RepID=A0AAE3IDI3_9EURY|nr:PAS domain-containing protein [Halapricum hydrolyticum]MCU4719270.1 PAS domain-containing protein [Halapricum hydrolyticum]MCU4728545.1 PAS domain-containing protein [Halapricum hydrolyticum]
MPGGELPGTLLVIDPDGRLEPITAALRRAGREPIRRVEQLAEANRSDVAAVLAIDAPATEDHPEQDGLATFDRVAEAFDSRPPVALYVRHPERARVNELLDAGVEDVIRVPPKREALLAARIDRLCGLDSVEPPGKQLESLLESYPETIYLKDCAGRFVSISEHSLDNREMSRHQRVGLTDYELFPGELPDRLYEEEQELLARGETLFENVEHYVENGEDRWVSTTKAPRYDEDGQLLGLVGDVRDVTFLKRQEHALATLHRASRRLIRAEDCRAIAAEAIGVVEEIDALPDARIVVDCDDGQVVEATGNGAIAWDETTFERAIETDETLYLADDGSILTGPERQAYEDTWLPDRGVVGARLPLGEHGAFGIETVGGVLESFTIELTHILAANVEAVLDRYQNQRRATRQAERIEQFARIGSHELRNNLQIAVGATERALAGDETAGETALATLERMDRLTSQLMTLARTGSMTRGSEEVALASAAGTAAESVTNELTVLADTGATVVADADALTEVLSVLFRNVAAREPTATVEIGVVEEEFYVADDADPRLDPDADDLFEPVYSERADEGEGSLYLVSVLAEALGWDVAVEIAESETRVVFDGVTVEST